MADLEATRQINKAYCVAETLDYCKSPTAPTAYMPVGCFDTAVLTTPSVKLTGCESFTMKSRLMTCTGNEGGVGGGTSSQCNLGYCRPIEHCTTVKSEGAWICSHDLKMEMNCCGPDGPANCTGRIKYYRCANPVSVGPDGQLKGDTKKNEEWPDAGKKDAEADATEAMGKERNRQAQAQSDAAHQKQVGEYDAQQTKANQSLEKAQQADVKAGVDKANADSISSGGADGPKGVGEATAAHETAGQSQAHANAAGNEAKLDQAAANEMKSKLPPEAVKAKAGKLIEGFGKLAGGAIDAYNYAKGIDAAMKARDAGCYADVPVILGETHGEFGGGVAGAEAGGTIAARTCPAVRHPVGIIVCTGVVVFTVAVAGGEIAKAVGGEWGRKYAKDHGIENDPNAQGCRVPLPPPAPQEPLPPVHDIKYPGDVTYTKPHINNSDPYGPGAMQH